MFSDYVCKLLNTECHRFFLTLAQQDIPNSHTRALAINQMIWLLTEDFIFNVLCKLLSSSSWCFMNHWSDTTDSCELE